MKAPATPLFIPIKVIIFNPVNSNIPMEPGRAGIEVVMLVTVVTNKIAGINNITLSKRPGMSKAKDVTKDDLLKTLQFYNASSRELYVLREYGKALVIYWRGCNESIANNAKCYERKK